MLILISTKTKNTMATKPLAASSSPGLQRYVRYNCTRWGQIYTYLHIAGAASANLSAEGEIIV